MAIYFLPPRETFFKSDEMCGNCFCSNPQLQCSRCKSERYCDLICQHERWFQHKYDCRSPQYQESTITAPVYKYDKSTYIRACEIMKTPALFWHHDVLVFRTDNSCELIKGQRIKSILEERDRVKRRFYLLHCRYCRAARTAKSIQDTAFIYFCDSVCQQLHYRQCDLKTLIQDRKNLATKTS